MRMNRANLLEAIKSIDKEEFSTKDIFIQLIREHGENGEYEDIDGKNVSDIVDILESETDISKSTIYRNMNDFKDNDIIFLVDEGNPKKYKRD